MFKVICDYQDSKHGGTVGGEGNARGRRVVQTALHPHAQTYSARAFSPADFTDFPIVFLGRRGFAVKFVYCLPSSLRASHPPFFLRRMLYNTRYGRHLVKASAGLRIWFASCLGIRNSLSAWKYRPEIHSRYDHLASTPSHVNKPFTAP